MKDLGKYGNTFANHLDLHRLQPDLMKWQLDIQPCKQCHYVITIHFLINYSLVKINDIFCFYFQAALSHRTLARHTRKYH